VSGSSPTILVVEDESSIASFVSLYLKNAGYTVKTASNGTDGIALVASEVPALIVLDLMLPDIDGIEVCKRVRQHSDVPILMLTARDEEPDRIVGLEVGADDYLTKPFSPRELVARMKAILRRSEPQPTQGVLTLGDVTLNRETHDVKIDGADVELTAKEFDLLAFFMANAGVVVSRDLLLDRVWGQEYPGGTRTVDVHVAQLRRKLGRPDLIRTLRGAGYKAVLQ
jgi:DNA-binding response OmpR family regulator